ncbi:MAG: lipopolysaccharide heptosyltransferase I [Candidatus Parcubacteria bacterium]|nr:lipopolysaccharide heptosyltransferase I [Burkholderiales bacterium]
MPRILFVKTSSLGDVVHNCPAVSDIARALPDAIIDWVVEESFAEVATLHPSVRRVIPVAIRRWRGELFSSDTWAEFARFRAALRSERYDAVIDSQGLMKSALVAVQALGLKHGYDRSSAREPFAARFYDALHSVPVTLHAVERNRQLAAASLGYVPKACGYGLRAGAEAPIQVRSPFALLLTMTSREDKLWPEEHWRALGVALEARGIHCLLPWGDGDEKRRCARIATAIRGAVVPRRMSLSELANLARHAHCVVGVDTGISHLAAALDVPVVGIYCGSDPALTGLYGGKWVRNLGAAGRPPAVAEVLEVLGALA